MKAIVLLSGGLDSTVLLALALSKGRECIALSFAYGQRHAAELACAAQIAAHYNIVHKVITVDPQTFAKSALVGEGAIVKDRTSKEMAAGGIPSSYVPARNTLFLAYALGQAEIYDAKEIHFGCNHADSVGYPDTRPEYIRAYQALIDLATKQSVESSGPRLITPLITLTKKEIVEQGVQLEAPLHLTLSCYDPDTSGAHCGRCDACTLRKEGFTQALQRDPTSYEF